VPADSQKDFKRKKSPEINMPLQRNPSKEDKSPLLKPGFDANEQKNMAEYDAYIKELYKVIDKIEGKGKDSSTKSKSRKQKGQDQ